MEMEIMFDFNVWIIAFSTILAVFKICNTVERVVEAKEVSKYSKLLEKEMENMPPKAREYAKELEKKKMTNREWLLNKMKNMSDEELVETLEKIVNECQYENTNYPCDSDCIPCKAIWLQAEHKEPITLSEAERIILENIDKKYFNYIARNKNGSLYLYFSKPYKNNDAGIWKELSFMHCEDFYMFKNLFQFITWNDEQPYNIEELLKCGD